MRLQPTQLTFTLWLILLFLTGQATASTYPLPTASEHIIGKIQVVTVMEGETLPDIAQRYDLGHNEIIAANPDVDPWLPPIGTAITLPTRFILPNAPRRGIVINLPELRLYYFPHPAPGEQRVVITHPISIGSEGRNLPMGLSEISEKRVKPSWRVPESIRAEHEAAGDPLPAVIPPGEDNPLGEYAMRLGNSSYLIHGTNHSFSIGMRISHGCIRLYPEDIEALFPQIAPGTHVNIINHPFKAGWLADELYVEAHTPLSENRFAPSSSHTTEMNSAVINASHVALDNQSWAMAREATLQRRGIPVRIMSTEHGDSLLHSTARSHPDLEPGNTWWLQAGAFSNIDNARVASQTLGPFPAQVNANLVSYDDYLCRVIIGPFVERTEALRFREQIQREHDSQGFLLHGSSLNSLRFCQTTG